LLAHRFDSSAWANGSIVCPPYPTTWLLNEWQCKNMNDRLRQDASLQIDGTIYQFYVALDKCFDLLEGEKVIIEKYGDVTVTGMSQIEVKHYEEYLTDLHENIWKTIDNWLQDSFEVNHYKSLILLTTQNFGVKSSFKEWNDKNKNEKKGVLDSIASKYKNKPKKDINTEKLLISVLDDKKTDKLLNILDKFIILDSSPRDANFFENIKQRCGKTVLPNNRDDYINSLLGYILSPQIRIGSSWEISYTEFTKKVELLGNQFRSETVIFPKKYSTPKTNVKTTEYEDYLFIKKIEEIDYHDAKSKAISDYINSNSTILEELDKYTVDKSHYDAYEQELIDTYRPNYNRASRNTSENRCICDAQNFYDLIIGSEPQRFLNFNDTPKSFRNGFLHSLANEEDKEIVWKLRVPKE
jgi:hypothetical protein